MIIYYTSIMYVQAKMVLGLSSATKAEELDSEDIHKKFISKLALVISRIRINQQYSKLNVFSQLFQTLTWTHGKEANSRHVRDV